MKKILAPLAIDFIPLWSLGAKTRAAERILGLRGKNEIGLPVV